MRRFELVRGVATGAQGSAPADPPVDLAARREHSFYSLLELSQELLVSLDLYGTADLLLFNLMGQFGTARAALWLLDEEQGASLVLVRSHGFHRQVVQAIGATFTPERVGRVAQDRAPVSGADIEARLGTPDMTLIYAADIALFAPLFARGQCLGLLALGPRIDGNPYSPDDHQVLQAALVMVGVSLENARLYNRMFDMNRQLRQSNEHLRELDRLKSEFLNNVNHELRTPVAVVIATLQCLLEQGSEGEKPRMLMGSALEKAQHLKGMVENLLLLSDVTHARLPVQITESDVGEVIEAYFQERLPGVTASLHEFSFDRESHVPKARVDRQRLIQILDELVNNAVKFTPRGCLLQLRVGRVSKADQGWVRVDIVDNGPGMHPDRIDSMFNSFEQADGSMTRVVGGLGIGLALARQLAERMGCRLTGTSAPGKGTTFSLLLPAAGTTSPPEPPPPTAGR